MIEQILEKYPNDVKVVFKNFPLGSHKQARKAGKYALAAHRQGDNGFKKMFMALFDDKDTYDLVHTTPRGSKKIADVLFDQIGYINFN